MGLINWIFDIYQQSRIESLKSDLLQSRADAANVRGASGQIDTQRLEAAIGELALGVKSMQRLMIAKGVCSHDELRSMIRTIDLEDGRADGQSSVRGISGP